jgi:hypothetical protein
MLTNEELLRVLKEAMRQEAERKPVGAPTDYGDRLSVPAEAFRDLVRAVPDSVVRSIVDDNMKGSAVAAPAGPKRPYTGGWVEPAPYRPPEGTEHCDRLMDAADAADRVALAERLAKQGARE